MRSSASSRSPSSSSLALALLASACGSSSDEDTGSTVAAASDCTPGKLDTHTKGELTVATDKPAYPPYFEDDDPTNGKGFESAVAYAIADQLGFDKADVKWTVEPFNSSYAPGPKDFDFDVNQISITPVARKGGRLLGALLHGQPGGRRAEGLRRGQAPRRWPTCKDAKIGVQIGTTSLEAVEEQIDPSEDPQVFNSSNDVSPRSRTDRSTRSSSTCRRRST